MAVKRQYVVCVSERVCVSVVDSGPPTPVATVILLHSWALNASVWDDVSEQLERVSPRLRVIAYDCRGHGDSDRVDADLRALSDDLAAVIERLVPEGPLVVAGHGMGGSVLLALSVRHQDLIDQRIGGVVFISTPAGPLVPESRQGRAFDALARVNTEILRRGGFSSISAPVLRRAVRGLYGRRADRVDVDALLAQAAHAHAPVLSALIEDLLNTDLMPALEGFVGMPAAVVIGGSDRLVGKHRSRRMADEMPGARHVVLPWAGHMLPTERAVDVAMVISGVVLEVVGSFPMPIAAQAPSPQISMNVGEW